ncbi:ComEC/Rec2 family competence protein [Hyphobacterium sp.]|uniref:ComEC/Rec2 family competence protein n=1 Tax=Hyphobacterium sp. TaxID=2004662 RepID=UPI003B520AE0
MELGRPVRLAIWAPVAFAIGAIAFFTLDADPPLAAGIIAAGLASMISIYSLISLRARPLCWSALLLLAMVLLGFARAQWHTHAQSGGTVAETERARTVTGWIEAVQSSRGRERLIVRIVSLDDATDPPRRLRFYGRRGALEPGDGISARVVLTPPRRPAAPGGYDPGFAAWFSGLGGSGYAIAPIEAARVSGDGWRRQLTRWRWQMAEHIRDRALPETAGIAAALLTGDRSGIAADQAESLRAAGLGHILAISGLHMSLFAGGMFFAVRAGLAAIPAFARRHDPRIPAALVALAGATLYLVLSGLSVSTQRAFVMVAVILAGVIFQRRAISMQSIALAATIILVLQPQSVLSPGFQMSFSAAAALVAAFEIWRSRQSDSRPRGWISGVVRFWGSLSMSSLVAGSATAAFAAFHFNRIAVYGFLANLAAMPVFSLIVMPAGALALALAPFGLDAPVLAVMSWGLIWVVGVADWVAGWPGALAPAESAPGGVVAVYALGFVLLVAASGLMRRIGLILIGAAYSVWWADEPPNLFISEDGVVLAQVDAREGSYWASSDRRRARFASRVFLEQAGSPSLPLHNGWACDAQGCRTETKGLGIAIAQSGESLAEDCAHAALVVLQERASPVQRAGCGARLIDTAELAATGAQVYWLDAGNILRSANVEGRRGRRIWTQASRER